MRLAHEVASNGTCSRAEVGAVLVNDDRVISIGYNGAPRGMPHCVEVGCDIIKVDGVDHCIRSVHAEENVIANAAFGGSKTKGATLYCTLSPCYACCRILVNAGIAQVYYAKDYPDARARELWFVKKHYGDFIVTQHDS